MLKFVTFAKPLGAFAACALFPVLSAFSQVGSPVNFTPSSVEKAIVLAGQIGVVPLLIDSHASGGSNLNIVLSAPAVVTVETPSGQIITSADAGANGFEWTEFTGPLTDVVPSVLNFGQFHVVFGIPSARPTGTYRIRVDAAQSATNVAVNVFAVIGSPIRIAMSAPTELRVGTTVKLRTLIFNSQSSVVNANLTAAVTPVILQPADRLAAYELVNQQSLPDSSIRYTYRATLLHRGQRIQYAEARLISTGPNLNVRVGDDDNLVFPAANPSQNVPALDTFNLIVRNGVAPPLGALVWRIENALEEIPITFVDGGGIDEQSGDGIYTAQYTPAVEGTHSVAVRANGNSPWTWVRHSATSFGVVQATAVLGSITGQLVDDDGNGKAEFYRQNVAVSVTEAGTYLLRLSLANGANPSSSIQNGVEVTLDAGSASVNLDFPAKKVLEILNTPGSLIRPALTLWKRTLDGKQFLLESESPAGATEPLNPSSFQGPHFQLLGSPSANGVRTSGRPEFDILSVTVNAVTPGGECSWSAVLRSAGRFANYYPDARDSGTLPVGAAMLRFEFSGAKIRYAGLTPPFELFAVKAECRGSAGLIEGDLGSSPSFSGFTATDFILVPPDVSAVLPAAVIALVPGVVSTLQTDFTASETGPGVVDVALTGFPEGIRFAESNPASLTVGVPNENYPLRLIADSGMANASYSGSLSVKARSLTKQTPLVVNVVPQPVQLSVSPSSASLTAGQTLSVQATVSGGSQSGPSAVSYSLEPQIGQISPTGLYQAPAAIEQLRVVRVRVRAVQDHRRFAIVTITLLPPGSLSISPSSAALHVGDSITFSATVGGIYGPAVNWSVEPAGSLILDAFPPAAVNVRIPGGATVPAAVSLRAAAADNSSVTSNASIQLLPSVVFSLIPPTTALQPGSTLQLQYILLNALDQSIQWALDPPLGTITPEGIYTAPSTIAASTAVRITGSVVESPTVRDSIDVVISGGTVNPPPSPWTTSLIGGAQASGDVFSFSNNAFRLGASGCCWLSLQDSGALVSQPVTGNTILTVRTRTVGPPIAQTGSAVAGLQLRSDGTPTSPYVGVHLLRDRNGRLSWAPSFRVPGPQPSIAGTGTPEVAIPVALPDFAKLVRDGNRVYGLYSNDNRNWFQLGLPVEIQLPATALVTLFAANTSATFEAVSLRSAPEFLLSAPSSRRDVRQTESTEFTFRSIPILGFSSPIQLSLAGLPAGASAAFNASTQSPGEESTLQISTGTATPGTYILTVNAQSGTMARSLSLTLVISEAVVLTFTPDRLDFSEFGDALLTSTLRKSASNLQSYRLTFEDSGLFTVQRKQFSPVTLANSGAMSNLEIFGFNSFWSQGNTFIRAIGSSDAFRAPLPYFRPAVFRVFNPPGQSALRGGSAVFPLRMFNSYPGTVTFQLTDLPPGFSFALGSREDNGAECRQQIQIAVPTTAPPGILVLSGVATQNGRSLPFSLSLMIANP